MVVPLQHLPSGCHDKWCCYLVHQLIAGYAVADGAELIKEGGSGWVELLTSVFSDCCEC